VTPEDWTRIRELFEAALPLSAVDRSALLDTACAGRSDLRGEITSLLAAHDGAGDFIELPAYAAAADLFVDGTDAVSGRSVGPYILRHEIGRGGMGVVYLAEDIRLSRRVALKAIAPGSEMSVERRERMRQEARAAAALSHPGIATVYALEEIEGELYLACEYVPGVTLRAVLQASPLSAVQVVDLSLQLALALAAAHSQGVVHRDLKPENVIRTATGVVKVLDFGLARIDSASDSRLTLTGTMMGTPGYMSPEQIRQEGVDFRSDIFALGVVMYEMASGTHPFQAESATATIARILETDPAPLHQVCSTGFTDLDRVVGRCLNKDPSGRYASTHALVSDLERVRDAIAALQRAPSVAPDAMKEGSSRSRTPAAWWRFHQVAASIVDVLMLYPAWRAHAWISKPWDMVFFFAALASAATGATVRLHLAFTARYYPNELLAQRTRGRVWTRISDSTFSASLGMAALSISDRHPEIATLLMAAAIATALAAFLIEPATARAAFPDGDWPTTAPSSNW
jgi:serine/threonine protein kinase